MTGGSSASTREIAGRPELVNGTVPAALRGHGRGSPRTSVINIKNKSYSITADIEVPDERRQRA